MPFPFTRKASHSSRASSRVNTPAEERDAAFLFPPSASHPYSGDNAGAASSNASFHSTHSQRTRSSTVSSTARGKMIRSFSAMSTKEKPGTSADMAESFQRANVMPNSRRISSYGPAGSSSSSIHGPASLSRSTSSSFLAVSHPSAASAQQASSTLTVPTEDLPRTRTITTPAVLQHSDDILHDSSSDDDDLAFLSPDEFSDSEDVPAASQQYPTQAAAQRPAPARILSDYATIAKPSDSESALRADIREIWVAISLFLNSRMIEAEKICQAHSADRLYYSLGYSMISSIKALMTFEPEDLGHAVELCKGCLEIATREKNRIAPGAPSRSLTWSERIVGGVGGVLRGGGLSVEGVKAMSVEQRHAEVCYAECILLKAIVSIIYSGDVYAVVKEVLNMRAAFTTYRSLAKYIDAVDGAYPSGKDPSIDLDFRSAVDFGNGMISLIISLLPSRAVRMMEMFGISGSREGGLKLFMDTGGWSKDPNQTEPTVGEGPGKEGLRRCVCDLVLLTYHLVISVVLPISDVDVGLADRILHYNLRRYPDGVFFLWFSGKLYSTKTLGEQAVVQFHKAIRAQKEYRQIQHICHWDLTLTHLSLAQYPAAFESVSILAKESNWSKAVYTYGEAITLYESSLALPADQPALVASKQKEAGVLMRKVPGLLKRIAGKSIPLEKYAVRKSNEFVARGEMLPLAGLELAYVMSALQLAPRYALQGPHLTQINEEVARVQDHLNSGKTMPADWYDRYCLAYLLKGIVLYLLAHPAQHVTVDPPELSRPVDELDTEAEQSLLKVIEHGQRIEQNHYLLWFAHLELGRVYTAMGDSHFAQAKEHLSLVLDSKVPMSTKKGKGKVSLQSLVVLRAQGAMDQLKSKMK